MTIAQQRARTWIQNIVAILIAVVAVVLIFVFIQRRTASNPIEAVNAAGVTKVEPAPTKVPLDPTMVLIQEDFNVERDSWEISPVQVTYQQGAIILNDGLFDDRSWARPHLKFDDFVLEVYARWVGGAIGGSYGVDFRLQEEFDDHYSFYLHNDGRYVIGQEINGVWTPFVEEFSPAINRSGGVNLIRIEALGPNMRFFVNDVYLTDVRNESLRAGDVRLVAEKVEGTESLIVAYDNFVVVRHPLAGE